jgi:hypothetical protein
MTIGIGTGLVRRTSKRLFNSQYRIEVAELVGSMGTRFTTQDLSDALDSARSDLPWSCVTKELAVLVGVGLVTRDGGRTSDGRIPYATSESFPSFLRFIEKIHPPTLGVLPEAPASNITPIRRGGADS